MDINKLLEKLINNMTLISPDEIPNISLYMDQVTTFMDNHLYSVKRFEDDKALTKTMINNYAKNDLLPSPEKKKYTKDHVLLLTFIYYFKSVLSISDIKKLLQPISDKFFLTDDGATLEDIYTEVENYMTSITEAVKEDVNKKAEAAKVSFSDDIFSDLSQKDTDYLKLFKFISMLSFDIYLKKQLIESVIDTLEEPLSKAEKEKLAKKEMEAREKRIKKEREEREKFKK